MTVDVIEREYKTLGELNHILSAHFESFPQLKLKHLPEILTKNMPVCKPEEISEIYDQILAQFAELRCEVEE
jgi:hypothetical protein